MVKEEEEVMAEAAGGGRGGYMDLLGLGEEDYLLCLSPSSSYFTPSVVSATGATITTTPAAPSPTCCAYYLDLAPAHHHTLGFADREQQYHGDDGALGFQHSGGDRAVPAAVPHKSSPTTECSSSVSSMSSSPPATAVSAVSSSKPQAPKKKGSRSSSDQRKAASAAAPATAAGATNKRPRVRRERLGERIIALQQLVSPFGKSDTASVLHEALGYIRFLHDQVQVLSSPYMQRQPAAHVPAQESAAGTVVEPPLPSDLRSRGLCLVPVSCTDNLAGHGHGHGNGADLWSVVAGTGMGTAKAAADNEGAAGGTLLPGGGHPRFTDYARV
ncbi:hypothetical protein Zm00014a_029380 [Zea mays]|nr:hypothetical protein Zm00014a_029380 [Zea mays]